jgi:hypothetical protein
MGIKRGKRRELAAMFQEREQKKIKGEEKSRKGNIYKIT